MLFIKKNELATCVLTGAYIAVKGKKLVNTLKKKNVNSARALTIRGLPLYTYKCTSECLEMYAVK